LLAVAASLVAIGFGGHLLLVFGHLKAVHPGSYCIDASWGDYQFRGETPGVGYELSVFPLGVECRYFDISGYNPDERDVFHDLGTPQFVTAIAATPVAIAAGVLTHRRRRKLKA
jgi:hypothetical protein